MKHSPILSRKFGQHFPLREGKRSCWLGPGRGQGKSPGPWPKPRGCRESSSLELPLTGRSLQENLASVPPLRRALGNHNPHGGFWAPAAAGARCNDALSKPPPKKWREFSLPKLGGKCVSKTPAEKSARVLLLQMGGKRLSGGSSRSPRKVAEQIGEGSASQDGRRIFEIGFLNLWWPSASSPPGVWVG